VFKVKNLLLKTSFLSVVASSIVSANSFFMHDIESDMNRINQMMNQFINKPFMMPNGMSIRVNSSYPNMNMTENDSQYILEFELAGMTKKDIKVTVSDNKRLTIEGTKENKTETNKEEKVLIKEIYYGKFQKTLTLPKDSMADKLKVDFKNGILKVTVPKDKNHKNKNIRVVPIN
jgi:HSP20 family protein